MDNGKIINKRSKVMKRLIERKVVECECEIPYEL